MELNSLPFECGNLYIAVFLVGFIGAITPGPDVLLILRNTIAFGAKTALIAFGGIVCGWVIYLSCVYFGFAYLINQPIMQSVVSVVGALYLGCLGYKILHYSIAAKDIRQNVDIWTIMKPVGFFQALWINLSNPKAILFFIVVVAPFADRGFKVGLLVLFCSLVCGFFCVIFIGLYVRKWLNAYVFLWIDRISAILFIGFACLLGYRGVEIFLQL